MAALALRCWWVQATLYIYMQTGLSGHHFDGYGAVRQLVVDALGHPVGALCVHHAGVGDELVPLMPSPVLRASSGTVRSAVTQHCLRSHSNALVRSVL